MARAERTKRVASTLSPPWLLEARKLAPAHFCRALSAWDRVRTVRGAARGAGQGQGGEAKSAPGVSMCASLSAQRGRAEGETQCPIHSSALGDLSVISKG